MVDIQLVSGIQSKHHLVLHLLMILAPGGLCAFTLDVCCNSSAQVLLQLPLQVKHLCFMVLMLIRAHEHSVRAQPLRPTPTRNHLHNCPPYLYCVHASIHSCVGSTRFTQYDYITNSIVPGQRGFGQPLADHVAC